LESSLFALLGYVLYHLYLKSVGEQFRATNISRIMLFVQLLVYMCVSVINLLPAMIIRFLVVREPLSGGDARLASVVHYATISLVAVTPYQILTGEISLGSVYVIFMLLARLFWALLSYVAAYVIIVIPQTHTDPVNEHIVPLDDSMLCLGALGEFMSILRGRLGAGYPMESLWRPVYAYLKNEELMKKLITTKGLAHDQIVLNAVGSMAFRLLSSGELHSSRGVLTPEGEYVREVWMNAGSELVNRMYSSPEEMKRGTEMMDAAVAASGDRDKGE
jgi:hypothetical protein